MTLRALYNIYNIYNICDVVGLCEYEEVGPLQCVTAPLVVEMSYGGDTPTSLQMQGENARREYVGNKQEAV